MWRKVISDHNAIRYYMEFYFEAMVAVKAGDNFLGRFWLVFQSTPERHRWNAGGLNLKSGYTRVQPQRSIRDYFKVVLSDTHVADDRSQIHFGFRNIRNT